MNERFTLYIRSFFGAEKVSFSQYFKNIVIRFKEDSLFQNSIYLMTSTLAMSLFGFAFWIITTRLYSTSDIGFATALISVTILLSTFSLFGFNTSLVRYLPKSEDPNSLINTSLITVGIITVIISAVYVLGIGYIAPQFNLLREKPLYGISFIVIMVLVSINMLTDSIFIAYRASRYNFIEYIYFGIAKIVLPLFLIALGTYGIFFSYTGSVIVALAVTFYYLYRKFNYKSQLVIKKDVIKHIGGFSLGNYAATFIYGFPALILPTIIVAKIGSSQSAYFYIASTIAALLYGIPTAMSSSLLAEGAHDENKMGSFVKSASKLIGAILLIGVLAFVVLGKFVLLIFGKNYAANSHSLLIVMAITSFFVAINTICGTVLRIQNRVKALVWISAGYAIATLLLIFYLLPHGIMGEGWALFFGQAFMSLEFAFLFWLSPTY
jgi:O-antigen/teichoic acid export membrane protein